jgi:hypothetical protein
MLRITLAPSRDNCRHVVDHPPPPPITRSLMPCRLREGWTDLSLDIRYDAHLRIWIKSVIWRLLSARYIQLVLQ